MDIWTGKEEVDIYERENPPPEPKNTYDPHRLFFFSKKNKERLANKFRSWEKIWFAVA